jgi:hypothetical protein
VFALSNHPTAITVSDGIQDAFKFLQTSWRKWLPAVAVMAGCSFALFVLAGSLDTRTLYHTDPITGRVDWDSNAASRAAGVILASIALLVVGFVASWLFNATAIAGLRNRPLTAGYVIGRGLIAFFASLILVFAVMAGIVALAILAVAVPTVGIVAILVAIPFFIYLLIRVTFVTLAVFDGFGPIEAIEESWRLSKYSVQRLFGWGLLAFAMTFAINIVAGIITSPFSATSGLAPLAQAASALVSGTGSVLIVYMMAVLYESERARKDPTLYPVPAFMGYGPYGPQPYAPGPYPARPYAPGPYTAGPYAGGPYPTGPYAPAPADPTTIPGWIGPNGPAPAWPSYPPQPYDPAQYQANQQGGWVAPGGPAPTWQGGPAPTWQGGPAPTWPGGPAPTPGPAPAWSADPAPANPSAPTQPADATQPSDATQPPETPAS